MSDLKIAFYHGRKSGRGPKTWALRFLDWLTRRVTKGPFSHCEIVKELPDGSYECFSSSYRDGGVRSKILSLNDSEWVILDAPKLSEDSLKEFKVAHEGQGYDLLGAVGVVTLSTQNPTKWFCSELVAEVLGLEESWRYCPNTLFSVVKLLEK